MTKKLTLDTINNFAKNLGIVCLSTEYKNNDSQMLWVCLKGHTWSAPFERIRRVKGNGCKKCHIDKTRLNGISVANKIAKSNGGECLSSTPEYVNNLSKLKFKCKSGHIWFATLNNIKDSKTWCFKCKNEKQMLDFNSVKLEIESAGGKLKSDKYNGANAKLEIVCEKGHTFFMDFHSIKSHGQWCPECKIFKTQKKLLNILEDILDKKAKFNFTKFDWLKNPQNKSKT